MAEESKAAYFDPAKKAFTLFEEFKNFAFKGNVVDLAIGVIIGGAFGKIVDSLVKNILMPLLSYVTPGTEGYEGWMIGKVEIGQFLATVINFLIVALALYVFIVKFLGAVLKTRKQEAVVPPPPTRDQELLMEIRDLLKARP